MRLSGKGGFILLLVDSLINLALGVLLLVFSEGLVDFFGVPAAGQTFYPNILGAVLFGIGLALLIECFRKPQGLIGLGLGGAVAINLCGGTVSLGPGLRPGGYQHPRAGYPPEARKKCEGLTPSLVDLVDNGGAGLAHYDHDRLGFQLAGEDLLLAGLFVRFDF